MKTIIFKGFLGAVIIACLVVANKLLGPAAAATVSWLPVFTSIGIVASYQHAREKNLDPKESLKNFLIGGIASVILLVVFAAIVFFTIILLPTIVSVAIALVVWAGLALWVANRNREDYV